MILTIKTTGIEDEDITIVLNDEDTTDINNIQRLIKLALVQSADGIRAAHNEYFNSDDDDE